jgi:hypothetical protein
MTRVSRLLLAASALASAAILATQLPLGELAATRATIAGASRRLSALDAEDRALAAQVDALRQPATVERIAHEQYGLVLPGARSVVVLPFPGDRASGGTPLDPPLPSGWQLVASDGALSPPPPPPRGGGASFWRRVLDRLEFWRVLS